jgi:CcmD family protein
MKTPKTLAATLLTLLLLVPALAHGAGGDDYQPYQPSTETVSAPLFVVLAYSAIWLAILVFVLSVFLRQRRVSTELDQVRRQLEEDAS